MLEASVTELRRLSMDADAHFALALIAEAEAFAGEPSRALQIARQELVADERNRPMLERAAGFALARLGQLDEAEGALMRALAHADERGATYDTAATISALDALGVAGPGLLRQRDEILARLKIKQLPMPALA